MEGTSLLDELMRGAKCDYLSDLHATQYSARVRMPFARARAEAYTAAEWNVAIKYITGNPADFENASEAARYLLGVLMEREAGAKK